MFQSVESMRFYFCILYIERSDKNEDGLRRRMALGTDKLPSERLQKESLVMSMKRNFVSKEHLYIFSKFWALRNLYERSRGSDVSNSRITLRNNMP
jgi:hypothetical protein